MGDMRAVLLDPVIFSLLVTTLISAIGHGAVALARHFKAERLAKVLEYMLPFMVKAASDAAQKKHEPVGIITGRPLDDLEVTLPSVKPSNGDGNDPIH